MPTETKTARWKIIVGYVAFRLGLEFIKPGDPIAGLTAIQWVCVVALATQVWPKRARWAFG